MSAESRRVVDAVAQVHVFVAEHVQAARSNIKPACQIPWPQAIAALDEALESFIARASRVLGREDLDSGPS
jgi:hypothetical protein